LSVSEEEPLTPYDPQATLALGDAALPGGSPQKERPDARTAQTADRPAPSTTPHLRAATRDLPEAAPATTTTASSNRALLAGVIIISILLLALVGIGITMLRRGSAWRERRNMRATNSNARAVNGNSNASASASPDTHNTNAELPPAPLKITVTASSTRSPVRGNGYEAANVLDKNPGSAWLEGVTGPGINEWIRCDFDREVKLRRILIAPGYFKSPQIWAKNNRLAAATIHFSDGSSREFRFPDRMEEQRLDVDGVRTAWVRIVIKEVYFGTDPDTAISQVAFEMEP
jgi:type II secretory pathway pseudopilin PulG